LSGNIENTVKFISMGLHKHVFMFDTAKLFMELANFKYYTNYSAITERRAVS
jgi:hypothetical protein